MEVSIVKVIAPVKSPERKLLQSIYNSKHYVRLNVYYYNLNIGEAHSLETVDELDDKCVRITMQRKRGVKEEQVTTIDFSDKVLEYK